MRYLSIIINCIVNLSLVLVRVVVTTSSRVQLNATSYSIYMQRSLAGEDQAISVHFQIGLMHWRPLFLLVDLSYRNDSTMILAGPIISRAIFLAFTSLLTASQFHDHVDVKERERLSSLSLEDYHRFRKNVPTTILSQQELEPIPFREMPMAKANNDKDDDILYAKKSQQFRDSVTSILDQDPSMAGPLIRLAFHDATTLEKIAGVTTGGANGSIRYELDRSENRALSKPLQLVEEVRNRQAAAEEDGLSLADAIALAGATAVEHAGGPRIPIRMGRVDAITSDPYELRQPTQMTTERSKVTSTMPSAALDSDGLRLYFGKRLKLQESEWVALSGVHGMGRHVTLLGMSKGCLKNLTRPCLEEAPQSLPFVTSSVDQFSNAYFQYLLLWYNRDIQLGDIAFIPTDVALVVDAGLRKHVETFAKDEAQYRRVFVGAFQKMVDATATSSNRY